MKNIFERIYANNDWGHGSGEGSIPGHVGPYVAFLQKFLRRRRIRSVVDFGCGDWQFSHLIDWQGIDYRGYDVAGAVISANRNSYQNEHISFHEIAEHPGDLPPADLLIVKDVLQHWSDGAIFDFLPVLSSFRFSLVTNCVNPSGPTENHPISDGDFRCLDLRLAPFRLAARKVLAFSNDRPWRERLFGKPRWTKLVLLLENEGAVRPARPSPQALRSPERR